MRKWRKLVIKIKYALQSSLIVVKRLIVVICVSFFWHRRVSLVKFNYWSTFHFNIITGSGVTAIRDLTRNPEIENTPIWVLFNIWRLGQVRDTKLDINVFNEKWLNAAKWKVYVFTISELLKENQQWGWGVNIPPPRLRYNSNVGLILI